VLLLPTLLVAVALVVGLVLLLRPSLMRRPSLEADSLMPRLSAEVHSGAEQVMIHVAHSLSVAVGLDQVGYGEIYVVSSAGDVIKLASRSEIGRGFEGEIRLRPGHRGTLAEYFVLRVPGDEAVHARVLRLEQQIADALRGIDPDAEVHLVAEQPRRSRARTSPRLPARRPGRPSRDQRSRGSGASLRRAAGMTPLDSWR
jgi:hypothetical protein